MSLTGVHMDANGMVHGNKGCNNAPNVSPIMPRLPMCRCGNYPRTTVQGDCTVCGAGFYESFDDWRDCIDAESAGFVESETDNFPVSLICYRGEKAIPVLNVRMDSITVKESPFAGYVNVEYESYGNSMVTGTIPMVDYYTTE